MGAAMKLRIPLLITAALLAPGLALATDAGTVLFATGSVAADREPVVNLAKGDAILDNDTISTGDASRAQLLMLDGAKIAIRPNSQLRIDEYTYVDDDSQAVLSTSQDKSVMSLVKGGFRTITGAIGKENKEDYEVRTPVGVLGIRGTDFALLFCRADCNWAPGIRPGAPVEDGLYIGVTEGAVVFRNQAGDIVVMAGEYAFIPLATRVPERLDAPPPVLIDDNDLRFDADGSSLQPGTGKEGPRTGFDKMLGVRRSPDTDSTDPQSTNPEDGSNDDTPEQPIIGVDPDGTPVDLTPGDIPDPANGRDIAYSTGPLGRASQVFSGTLFNDPTQVQLDAGNNVVAFTGPYPNAVAPDTANFDIGTSTSVDTGFDSITVLRWGRWAGGTANGTLQSDGSDVSLDLTAQSLHWVSGPDQPPPVMPITGIASYSLIGSTAPTNNLGDTGILGSATFQADFTNMLVDSTLVIDIAGSNWSATGTGVIGAAANLPDHVFGGNYGSVVVDGIAGGTGIFSGFFSQPGTPSDPAFPGGAGLTYSLLDAQGASTVSGAATFGDP
jgi:hypothetical protein